MRNHWAVLIQRLHSIGLGRLPGRVIRRLFALSPAPTTRPTTSVRGVGGAAVDVYTFVTDEQQYRCMLTSFADAGFAESATFTRLTDSDSEPYSAINRIGAENGAAYAVLCHQDVELDADLSPARFFAVLSELERLDSAWAVAGPVGVTGDLEVVRRVEDLHGGPSKHQVPQRVMSLDELFLVLNRRNAPQTTAGLAGFHFYGTDVCLRSIASGKSAWVVDLPMRHGFSKPEQSEASLTAMWEAYGQCRAAFIEAWRDQFWFRYVGTSVEGIGFGYSRVAERLLGSRRVLGWVTADRDRAINVLFGKGT